MANTIEPQDIEKITKWCYVIFNTCSNALNGGSFKWLFEDYEAKAVDGAWNNQNTKVKAQAAKFTVYVTW